MNKSSQTFQTLALLLQQQLSLETLNFLICMFFSFTNHICLQKPISTRKCWRCVCCVWGLGGVQHNCWRPKAQLAPHSSTRARTPQAKHFATLLAVYTTAGWFSMDSICAVTKEVAGTDWPSLRSAHWPRVIDLALCRKCVLQLHAVCSIQCVGWYSFRFFLWQLSCMMILNVHQAERVSWKLAKM